MTSPTSAIANPSPASSRTSARRPATAGGFTLLELLITIGIVALLIGILLPTVGRAMRAGKRAAIAAQLQSISVALESYKNDYKDYPRVSVVNTGAAVLGKALMAPGPVAEPVGVVAPFNAANTYLPGDLVDDAGSYYVSILTNPSSSTAPSGAGGTTYWKPATFTAPLYSGTVNYTPGAMVSFASGGAVYVYVCTYPVTGVSPPTAPVVANGYWSEFNWSDGGDDQQYRTKRGSAIKSGYLQSGTFKMVGSAIVDRNSNPILYFPASSAPRNIGAVNGYIGAGPAALYNGTNNLVAFSRTPPSGTAGDADAAKRFAVVMGDLSLNGAIDSGTETAATTDPFILWSAGPDGLFGSELNNPSDVARCDDVTNFR